MRVALIAFGLLFALGCGTKPSPATSDGGAKKEPELERLQGVWSIEAIEDGLNAGKTKPPEGRVQIQGKRMILTLTRDDPGERYTFAIDPDRTPKWITLTAQEDERPGQKQLEPLVEEGIYRLEADELIVARSPVVDARKSPRPKEFQARAWPVAKLGQPGAEPAVIVWRLKKTAEPFFTPKERRK